MIFHKQEQEFCGTHDDPGSECIATVPSEPGSDQGHTVIGGADDMSLTTGGLQGKETAMLVLSRKKGESIVIDGNIVVTVLEFRGNTVRLGIEAPGEIPVLRYELVVPLPPGENPGETSADAA